MAKRVVITGIGVVSPAGIGGEALWESSLKGESGVKKIKKVDPEGFPTSLGAEVEGFVASRHIKKHSPKSMDITSQFAVAASNLAVSDAGLEGRHKIIEKAGVVVGTTLGTISFILDQENALNNGNYRSIHKLTGYMALHNAVSSDISIEVGAFGVSETISSACVSGLSSVDYALRKIRHDGYDLMLAGGSDSAFRPLPYAGLNTIRILTDDRIRPFDRDSDGTVLGEGAAILVLEEMEHARKRKAKIYCEVLDTCLTCEGKSYFGHEEEPVQAVNAIKGAIEKSGIKKEELDFVNTHGLGVKVSDMFENVTYKAALGEDICSNIFFTSIKPYVGHPLAAASALQIVYSALMMKNGTVLATLNFENAIDGCCLNVLREHEASGDLKYGLVNSNAFGGKCGACVIKRCES
jgi:3-oxoacyl-[acyl-carrier-protein] synthase II